MEDPASMNLRKGMRNGRGSNLGEVHAELGDLLVSLNDIDIPAARIVEPVPAA